MAASGLSDEEFARMQEQLLQLRTDNYELHSKLKKAQTDLTQEKESQKSIKGLKFSGFQVGRKGNKKEHEDLQEENERINKQLQRQEEDFKLQNKTLLEELSRLASEKEEAQRHLKIVQDAGAQPAYVDDELRHLKARNAALQATVEEMQKEHVDCGNSLVSDSESANSAEQLVVILDELSRNTKAHCEIKQEGDVRPDDDILQSNSTLLAAIADANDKLKSIVNGKSASHSGLEVELRTEIEEKLLFQQQLLSEQETSKRRIDDLSQETESLKEKLKKKQESLVGLQQDMEANHHNHQQSLATATADHEQAMQRLTTEMELCLSDKTSLHNKVSQAEELQTKLDLARSEQATLQNEVLSLRDELQTLKGDDHNNLSQLLEERTATMQQQVTEIEELKAAKAKQDEQLNRLKTEADGLTEHLKEAEQIAEKRKMFLDALSTERQSEAVRHNEELQSTRMAHEAERDELLGQVATHKKSKRELSKLTERCEELGAENKSLHERCNWLQRSLDESEITASSSKLALEQEITETRIQHQDEVAQLRTEHTQSMDEKRSICDDLTAQLNEKDLLCQQFQQSLKDKDVEYAISLKKGEHLIRDLKRQLKSERKRSDQAQQRTQDILSSVSPRSVPEDFGGPDSSRGHRRQDSGSHMSVASSSSGVELYSDDQPLFMSKNSSASNPVSDETVDLISKVAELQQEKWMLEEKVRHLEENGAMMAEDLMQKSAVIQSIVLERRGGSGRPDDKRQPTTLKNKMIDSLKLGKYETLKEANDKLQRMLEETLTKNIQLEKDVDMLTTQQHQERTTRLDH